MRLVAEAALVQAEEALDADEYSTAKRLLGIAETAVKKSSSPPLLQRVQTVSKEAAELAAEFQLARTAPEILRDKPDDPEASLKWGRFLALVKGHWDAGLPLLAQGNDAPLRAVAAKDLAYPREAAAQRELGDAWWDLAQAQPETGLVKTQLLLRAKFWYEQAIVELAGLTRLQLEKRLKEIQVLTRGPETPTPTVPGDPSLVARGLTFFRQGNYIKAVEAFTEAVEAQPNDRRLLAYLREAKYRQHFASGYSLGNSGQGDEAIREFQLALEVKPRDPAATYYLNLIFQAQKRKASNK
jgi:tetratricopeptide (TPR) repeat protein